MRTAENIIKVEKGRFFSALEHKGVQKNLVVKATVIQKTDLIFEVGL